MRPCSRALAMPKEAEKSTRPTASSMATTISSRRVRGPSALYCLTTIRVAAGAVAAAIAPSVMAEAMEMMSGRMKCRMTSAASTRAVVMTACKMPTVMACLPMLSRAERRNSLPMTKAMKPSATWVMRDRLSTCLRVPKPMPKSLRPRRPRKKGPSSRPASRYDVTAGKWIAFARRDIKRPAMSAVERQMRSCSMRYCGQQHDTDAQPPFPPFSQSGAFSCCLPKAQKTQHSNKLYYSAF